MQTKKDIVNEMLLKAAMAEFMAKGYKGASIRNIVKNASTTIGNFYNYYESKEAIFSQLVEESYNALVYYIQHHNDENDDLGMGFMENSTSLREKITEAMAEILPFFDERALLLLDKSQGTKYENSRQVLIDVLDEHFTEHFDEIGTYDYPQMGRIIAVQLVSGIVDVISQTKDAQKRTELMVELILFNIVGVFGLFDGGSND